jgi:hypothetical protein
MASTSTKTISARVPIGLHEKLLKLARRRNENLNDYILRTLATVTQYRKRTGLP